MSSERDLKCLVLAAVRKSPCLSLVVYVSASATADTSEMRLNRVYFLYIFLFMFFSQPFREATCL